LKFKIRKCTACNRYTLQENCPVCGKNTVMAHPAKFSPDDKYILLKAQGIKKKSL